MGRAWQVGANERLLTELAGWQRISHAASDRAASTGGSPSVAGSPSRFDSPALAAASPERQAELDAKLEQLREELSELAEKEREAQAAHAKEVQSLQQQHEAELGEKDRVHALEQAEAARLEERWQARVREAQRKQREYQIASPHEDEDVFVCYVCMNRVTVL